MKPLSNSSPISSKVGLDSNVLMKSPHDLMKSKDYLPPDFGSIGKGKVDSSLDSGKHAESSSKVDSTKPIPLTADPQPTDFSMPSRVGGESFLNQMLELTKKTTMPDYMADYHQPLKLTEEEGQITPPSSHSYSNTSSIVDTIAQVAMGNYSKMDEVMDYTKGQDYSTNKNSTSENEK